MSKIEEYERGYRDGIKAAITFLHVRAFEMNDPSARAALNVAATSLGSRHSRKRIKDTRTERIPVSAPSMGGGAAGDRGETA